MGNSPQQAKAPELIFGLVAPIGVDLDLVTEVLIETLDEMQYSAEADAFRLTRLMKEVPLPVKLAAEPYIQSVQDRITYANKVRERLGDDALAALAISAIRAYRVEKRTQQAASKAGGAAAAPVIPPPNAAEDPLPNQAYIVRQFKRPEEIALLRSVYGKQFIVVSAFAPLEARKRKITEAERKSRGGLISEVDAKNNASTLMAQDAMELSDQHGQNVRDAFPLGDVFIDASSRKTCEASVKRFIHLLFGNNQITPTHDEYGMYLAKSASLRSSDLSRQVGAAIFSQTGEIITLGCNEVPKAGGGTYWSDGQQDSRDFVQGHDPNDRLKRELLVDIIDRLKKKSHLSGSLLKLEDTYKVVKKLLEDTSIDGVGESRLMDIIEFGRIIHAEMSAITDAARKGLAIQDGTLFCTTFPCHLCTKHIVAAGIRRLVFLEPYPKSYASDLHGDSIDTEETGHPTKVSFEPFIGISPFRYRDLFEKGKRKYSGGIAQKWNKNIKRPMIEVYFPSYFAAELHVVGQLSANLEAAEKQAEERAQMVLPGSYVEQPEEADMGPAPTRNPK